MGRGSPLSDGLREKIVSLFKENVPQRKIAQNLGLSLSTVNNILKRFKESGEILARKGQGRKPLLNAHEHRALRRYCLRNRPGTVMEIATWARENFGKSLSLNTVRRCIKKCNLKLNCSKKKPGVNLTQKRRRGDFRSGGSTE